MQLPTNSVERNKIYSILQNGLFGNFFKEISTTNTNNYVLLEAKYLINKCIIVRNIITEVAYDFEHD
jgi:hypothetical protein